MDVSPTKQSMDVLSATLFVLLALLWGSSFTFIKMSLEGMNPAQVVLFRLLLGGALLLAVTWYRHVRLPRGPRL